MIFLDGWNSYAELTRCSSGFKKRIQKGQQITHLLRLRRLGAGTVATSLLASSSYTGEVVANLPPCLLHTFNVYLIALFRHQLPRVTFGIFVMVCLGIDSIEARKFSHRFNDCFLFGIHDLSEIPNLRHSSLVITCPTANQVAASLRRVGTK